VLYLLFLLFDYSLLLTVGIVCLIPGCK